MKVRMRANMSGPNGCINAGQIADVDPEFGAALIKGRYADAVDPPPIAAVENAMIAPPETAMRLAPPPRPAPLEPIRRPARARA